MRKWLRHALERGQITLRLSVQSEGVRRSSFQLFNPVKNLQRKLGKARPELGYDPAKMIDLPFLVAQMQTMPLLRNKEEEEGSELTLKEVMIVL